jgi:hypothetical protein
VNLYDVLPDEFAWTKGSAGRDAAGNLTDCDAPDCARRCLLGAIYCAADSDGNEYLRLSDHIYRFLPRRGETITDFNDAPDTTFADVVALLKRAGLYEEPELEDAPAEVLEEVCA